IERGQKRFVEIPDGIGLFEAGEESLTIHPIQRRRSPGQRLLQPERSKVLRRGNALEQRIDEWYVQCPSCRTPIEAGVACLRDLHPGTEQTVEQRLYQRAAEQVLALGAFKPETESFLQGVPQFGEGGKARLLLDPRQSITCVGGEEERNVLRPSKGRLVQQHAFKKLGEARRKAGWTTRATCQRKKRGGIRTFEAEDLPSLRLTSRVAPEQHKVAVVRDEDEAVGGEVTMHLVAAQLDRQVRRDVVHFHDPAFRCAGF